MKTISASSEPPGPALGRDIRLRAIVHHVRAHKNVAFLYLRTPRGLLQAVWTGPLPAGLVREASVEVSGHCVPAALRDPSLSERELELRLDSLELLGTPREPTPVDLTKPQLEVAADTLFDLRPLILRHPKIAAVFRVQAALCRGFREYLDGRGFCELHTPKLVAEGAEGGANLFELDYFGRRATLAQSPQFYKEFGTGAFLRVYEIGPVFRAEKHDTSRHLNEYTSMDIELGPIRSFEEIMQLQTGLLGHMLATASRDCAHELALLGVELPEVTTIPSLTFAEAKTLVGGSDKPDLAPAEEAALGEAVAEQTGSDWVFVTHYPSAKRPFYAMDDPADPAVTLSFDLLLRGVEITTGGQRIHEHEMLEAKLRARGLEPESFAFFSTTHRHGLPPHGGFGMGLERLTQQLLGLANVKQACLFPRDRTRLTP
jgi:nondiscriminating aspartyl-tRNA synthetase